MKDYSKYFENPASYIIAIDTVYDEEEKTQLAVKYACGKVNYYPLTKENVELFFNRLEEQYLSVCSSSKKIFKYRGLAALTLTLLATLGATLVLNNTTDPVMISSNIQALLAAGVISSETLRNVLRKDKIEECKRMKSLIDNLSYIEQTYNEDPNILAIDLNENPYYTSGATSSPININLLDRLSKKELVDLKDQIDIYYGLQNNVELKRKYK